jgi:ABC-type branched-subunit amino acid transport system ATPase component/branched-subunit amino acid ABC-type transport system permease component
MDGIDALDVAGPGTTWTAARAARFLAWPVGVALFHVAVQRLWPAPLGIVLQGLILGSLTALIAFGVGLVHRASRVVNLAQADLGIVPMGFFIDLVVRKQWSFWPALAVALLMAAGLGYVVERVVIRWFSDAPRLMVMVATIGLGQVLFGLGSSASTTLAGVPSTADPVVSSEPAFAPPFDFHLDVGLVRFHGNHLLALLIVVAVVPALFFFLHRTDTGLALRAGAERSDRALLLGIPIGRIGSFVWMAAGALAALAMILRAGIFGVPGSSLLGPTFLLRALTAAVLGRMERFGVMLAAALGLGVLESCIFWATRSSISIEPILFVVIVAALVAQRRGRSGNVEDQATSSWREVPTLRPVPRVLAALPEVRVARWTGIVLLAALVVLLPLDLGASTLFLLSEILVLATAALAFVVLTGWAGEVSLGLTAVMFVGVAVATSLVTDHGVDMTVALVAAGAAGAVATVVIGAAGLRTRALFVAVATLSLAACMPYLLKGDLYLPSIPFLPNVWGFYRDRPALAGVDVTGDLAYYYVCLGGLVSMMLVAGGLRRARTARAIIAVKENPRAAQSFGLHRDRLRLVAFAASGFFAGFSGALLGFMPFDLPDTLFIARESLRALSGAVIGGAGSIPGVVLGTVLLRASQWFAEDVPQRFRAAVEAIVSGGGLLVVMMVLPGGLASLGQRLRDAVLRAVASSRDLDVPALAGESAAAASPRLRRRTRGRLPLWLVGAASGAPRDASGPLLRLAGVDAGYGAVQVLFGLDLVVERGQVVALLGTNGAGKSTLLNAVSGIVASAGSITFEGQDLTALAAPEVAALGVVQLPGGRGIFPSLTVADHLRLAVWRRRRTADAHADRAAALARFPVLAGKLRQPAANLSKGQQQMLTCAMALAARPRLLLVDELSLGLGPVLVAQLVDIVRELRDAGVTVLVVDQSIDVALAVADTAYFLEKGEVRFSGPASDLLGRTDILRSVFLPSPSTATRGAQPRVPIASPAPAERLRATDVTVTFGTTVAVDAASLVLQPGEILGLIGPNGAGKTTWFDAISGFVRPDAGRVTLHDQDITEASPERRAHLGLSRSFQDARLFGALTVEQAILVALDRHLDVRNPFTEALHLPAGARSERAARARVTELTTMLGLEPYRERFCEELSTGMRRVADLACQLAARPDVILFDEPSSGIAQREAEALTALLLRVRDETGASLLVIEHDVTLIGAISDRLIAMDEGRVIASGAPAEVLGHPDVVASYLGAHAEPPRPRRRRRSRARADTPAAPADLNP